jgi:hypothetical protein
MINSEQYQKYVEHAFNAFGKIVLYHATLGVYKELRKKQKFEASLKHLREFDLKAVTTADEYFVKYKYVHRFYCSRENGHCER